MSSEQGETPHNPANPDQNSAHPSPPGSSGDPSIPSVRKIPASQLSFFPPGRSSTTSLNPSPTRSEHLMQRTPYLKPAAPGSKPGSSPAHSLSSLLTAFPIAASTRDEIVSRLSFDSVSSSYSDTPRSRTGSDEETGHEMGDVNKRKPTSLQVDEDSDLSTSPILKTARPPYFGDIPLLPQSQRANGSSIHKKNYGRPLLSTSPPSSYVPQQPVNPYVRTQQLEPSPGMQIPSKGSHSTLGKSASSGFVQKSQFSTQPRVYQAKRSRSSVADVDFGIELEHP
jgi:hypothetical protein